jgi:hypothetical protein
VWSLRAQAAWLAGHVGEAEAAWREAGECARQAGEERELFESMGWRATAAVVGPTPVDDAIRRCEEFRARVAASPVAFTWYAQIAEDSDVIDDPATPWPDDRQRVSLGHVQIDQVGPNSPEADQSLTFLPGSLPPGIQFADPMLTIRNTSYALSFQERNT